MLNKENYQKEFAALLAVLEKRRRRYLLLLYLCTLIALSLATILLYCMDEIILVVLKLCQRPLTVDVFDRIWFGAVLVLAVAYLILMPIYRYRGTHQDAALKTFDSHRFSLKDMAYSHIFKLFGPFEFAPRGGVTMVETRGTTLFQDRQLYLPEDYMVGALNDVQVKLCQANIARIENKKRISVFQGLLVVCDISESKIKLRRDFQGHTSVIYDPKKEDATIAARYASMQRFELPEPFEPVLEGYTTNVPEAQAVITTELLEAIDHFAQQLQGLTQQVTHWDDRLAHAVAAVGNHIADRWMGNSGLPSEIEQKRRYETNIDITKEDPLCTQPTSLNRHFELEYYRDKFIIVLPCPFDLFETDSIFEPALNDEDRELVYGLMHMLENVTAHLGKI